MGHVFERVPTRSQTKHSLLVAQQGRRSPGDFAYFLTFWPRTAPWSGLDPSRPLRTGPDMLPDRFSPQTIDSGPIWGHFLCFWPNLKIRSGPNLARNPNQEPRSPNQACRFRNFFLGPRNANSVFCRHTGNFMQFLEMHKMMLAELGRHPFLNFLDMRRKTCRKKSEMGPRKKVPESAGLVRDDHSRPLTKYFPPMESATAADLAQVFEPVLRRLRQQPT